MRRIILTGGGTAGHVTPHLALLPYLKDWDVHYIGTQDGMERGLVEHLPGVTYHAVSSGKLRRYMDVRNLTDPFRVLKGVGQAYGIMRELRPDVVFSKGGFVSVPVVYGAFLNGVPVVLHESDMTPGLSNRLCMPFAKVILTSFPETAENIAKAVYTGTPLRAELFSGDRERALKAFGIVTKKPVLLVTGGSSGAQAINAAVREDLHALCMHFFVLHLCGRGNLDAELNNTPGYKQLEYLADGMADAFAAADVVVSRAGSNTLCELLALRKPALLIPYPASASRGEQLLNARSFEKRGFSAVLEQENMTQDALLAGVMRVYNNRYAMIARMEKVEQSNGTLPALAEIEKACTGNKRANKDAE